jgi:hypothetical protein
MAASAIEPCCWGEESKEKMNAGRLEAGGWCLDPDIL